MNPFDSSKQSSTTIPRKPVSYSTSNPSTTVQSFTDFRPVVKQKTSKDITELKRAWDLDSSSEDKIKVSSFDEGKSDLSDNEIPSESSGYCPDNNNCDYFDQVVDPISEPEDGTKEQVNISKGSEGSLMVKKTGKKPSGKTHIKRGKSCPKLTAQKESPKQPE